MKHVVSKSIIRRGYEIRDINAKGLFWFVVILLITVVIIHIAVGLLFKLFASPERETFAAELPVVPPHEQWPQPAQQISPHEDLNAFRAKENQFLHSYGWVDRSNGVVRIPIERAMELVIHENANKSPSANR